MNTSLRNYWSLYLDFLNDFKDLTYSGYSIAYLFCHFYSLVSNNTELWNSLSDKDFTRHIKSQVNDQKEIQDAFYNYIQKHKGKSVTKSKHGKVVFHQDKLLRISRPSIMRIFHPSQTMIVHAGINKSAIKVKSARRKKPNKAKVLIGNHAVKKKKPKTPVPVKKTSHTVPTYYLTNYPIETEKVVTQVQNKARKIIASHKNHPVYKNQNFQSYFLNMIAEIIKRIEQSRQFLNDKHVSCLVVSTTHGYISRILSLVAAEKGIPTICMQHGIIASEFGYIPKIATVDAVYGDFEAEWYKKLGAPDVSLEIIGHPRFDQAFSRPTIERERFNNHLGLDNSKQTLMIVIRENQDNGKWRTLIETIGKLNLNVVIKNYPSKTPHPLTKEFSFVYSTAGYSIYDIFPNVDAVVSYASTVGLEAMLSKKPVFILNNHFPGYTGYYNELDKLVQTNPRILGKIIIDYFSDPSFKCYVEKKQKQFLGSAYPDVSHSGERLQKLVKRITRNTVS
ncbi:hypothetical protein QGM71_12105 [Virgibacillus sp. C22-A2]|uniref:Uncharacterized protein n=1 Tax=Virgibacillus tibetensis TaxID=3042313 RepID=A0ABU6KIK8_9BACI|nr:hypothetical protein [Virgibacillus sp. C22-A2]